MPQFIIIEKNGSVKPQNVKTLNASDLYKKAGFKTEDGFKKQNVWNIKKFSIELYGKTNGRAGQENKYDFPPPVDKVLFFGSCLLVNRGSDGSISDLTVKDWEVIYEDLFGGFEDIDDEDTDEDEDSDEDVSKTKEGYEKDGFIVDDDEEEEEDEEEDEEEEDEDEIEVDEEEIKPKRMPKTRSKTSAKKIKTKLELLPKSVFVSASILDLNSELTEEDYE